MIDLCIDARMAFSSGIGTCIREIVPYFNVAPFRPILLVDRLDQPWCKGFEQIHFPAPIYSLAEQITYRKTIPSCDLFWSPHYNVPLLPIRAKKRIATIHDAYHLALGRLHEKGYAHVVMRKAFYSSDVVTTVSQFSKEELCRHFGPREVHVIPIGVNTERFQRVLDVDMIQQVKDRYDLPDRFILFIGNLKPHKNVQGLVRAFQRTSLENWGLVLAGRHSGFQAEDPRVRVTGEIAEEDLPTLYSLADLFVFPSFYEGFGLPPLEAMSCGCPTAVSEAASIPEVCGEASLYFQPDRIDEMAAAIEKAARNGQVQRELVVKGFERIKQFDWRQTGERYLRLFEQVRNG